MIIAHHVPPFSRFLLCFYNVYGYDILCMYKTFVMKESRCSRYFFSTVFLFFGLLKELRADCCLRNSFLFMIQNIFIFRLLFCCCCFWYIILDFTDSYLIIFYFIIIGIWYFVANVLIFVWFGWNRYNGIMEWHFYNGVKDQKFVFFKITCSVLSYFTQL